MNVDRNADIQVRQWATSAPDVVVGLASIGGQIVSKFQQSLLGTVTPVRLMVLVAVQVDVVAALAEHAQAWEPRNVVVPA